MNWNIWKQIRRASDRANIYPHTGSDLFCNCKENTLCVRRKEKLESWSAHSAMDGSSRKTDLGLELVLTTVVDIQTEQKRCWHDANGVLIRGFLTSTVVQIMRPWGLDPPPGNVLDEPCLVGRPILSWFTLFCKRVSGEKMSLKCAIFKICLKVVLIPTRCLCLVRQIGKYWNFKSCLRIFNQISLHIHKHIV